MMLFIFSASSQVGESMTYPLVYYENTVCGTRVLPECMIAHKADTIPLCTADRNLLSSDRLIAPVLLWKTQAVYETDKAQYWPISRTWPPSFNR